MNQKLVIEERKLKSGDELFTVLPRWNTSSESLFKMCDLIFEWWKKTRFSDNSMPCLKKLLSLWCKRPLNGPLSVT